MGFANIMELCQAPRLFINNIMDQQEAEIAQLVREHEKVEIEFEIEQWRRLCHQLDHIYSVVIKRHKGEAVEEIEKHIENVKKDNAQVVCLLERAKERESQLRNRSPSVDEIMGKPMEEIILRLDAKIRRICGCKKK